MPTDNSERQNTELHSSPQAPRKSTELLEKIVALVILAELIGVWLFVIRIVSRARFIAEGPPVFILFAIGVGLSLIGWGFAKWLVPQLPGISVKRTLKYIVGVLLAVYVVYPTYENFRGDDDISLATFRITGTKTIADVRTVAPRINVLQHGPGTYRVEVTQRDIRRLARKGLRVQLIENPEQMTKVRKLDRIPAGTPNAIIQQMIHAVSADSLLATIRRLERFGTRVDHSPQADSAAELLSNQFKQYGLEVESQAFDEPRQEFLAVHVVDDNTLFVSNYEGQLLCSTDGGRTWICRASGVEPLMRLSFADSRVGYALSWAGRLFATSDGGQTWRPIRPDSIGGYSDVRCLTPWQAIVVGRGGRILRTEDGGKRWKRMSIATEWNLHRIDSPDGKNIWVVGDGGTLLQSTDVGETWNPVNPGTSGSLRNVQFLNRQQGIVLADSARVLITGDGGRSWKSVGNEAREFRPAEMLFTDMHHGWIVSGEYGGAVLETSDGGRHWMEPRPDVRAIRMLSSRGTRISGERFVRAGCKEERKEDSYGDQCRHDRVFRSGQFQADRHQHRQRMDSADGFDACFQPKVRSRVDPRCAYGTHGRQRS